MEVIAFRGRAGTLPAAVPAAELTVSGKNRTVILHGHISVALLTLVTLWNSRWQAEPEIGQKGWIFFSNVSVSWFLEQQPEAF